MEKIGLIVIFLGVTIIIFSSYISALEITINSPIENHTYSQYVPINLITDIPAKCGYNFWFPDPYNENGQNGIIVWFGTNYYTLIDTYSTKHIATVDFGNFNYVGFECIDNENNTKTIGRTYVNINKNIISPPVISPTSDIITKATSSLGAIVNYALPTTSNLYDDFSSGTLDTSKWEIRQDVENQSFMNEYWIDSNLGNFHTQQNTTGDYRVYLVPKRNFTTGDVLEYDTNLISKENNYMQMVLLTGDQYIRVGIFGNSSGTQGYDELGISHIKIEFQENNFYLERTTPSGITLIDNLPLTKTNGNYELYIGSVSGHNGKVHIDYDNFSINGPGFATCSPTSETTFPIGTTTITCNTTDYFGNTATSNFNVLVNSPTFSFNDTNSLDLTPFSIITNDTNELNATVLTNLSFNSGDSNNISVQIPAGIIIIGNSSLWDGTIGMPHVIIPTINTGYFSGYTLTFSKAIEVGSPNISLSLNQPVKIIIPNEGGKSLSVGYSHDGVIFVPIATCTTSLNETNLPAGGSCYYDDGTNINIWTRHFTQFMTYTQTAIPSSSSSSSASGGGGGGGSGGSSSNKNTIIQNISKSNQTITLNNETTNNQSPTEENKGFFAGITGAIIGGGTNRGIFIVVGFILIIGITIFIIKKKVKK